MSYSRWSHSDWYTYADVRGGFTVCGVVDCIPAEDIRSDIEGVLDRVAAKCGESEWAPQEMTPGLRAELKRYMLEYLEDEQEGD